MEFDSPEVAKEFPGLYNGVNDMMSDPAEHDDEDKKKKKDKKDSKKDKGYAALAGESSHDEEDPALDKISPGKKSKLGFKLSGKKKDKDKDKEKDGKKVEKDKKSEKFKFSEVIERKSADKEVTTSRMQIPFSAERHKDFSTHRSSVPSAFMPSSMITPKSSSSTNKSESGETSSEKPSVSALNAFLNAPAPLFMKKKDKSADKEPKKEKENKKDKDKDHKKDKEAKENKKEKKEKTKDQSSSVAKKLKLMRSKNSLDESHGAAGSDPYISVSHQFPEDPESIAKEIKKYEQLLEQTHTQIKSSKKVSKKHEEQLWELQRTLTQLKRKLRSVNALSSASMNVNIQRTSSKLPESSNSIPIPPPPNTSSTEEKKDPIPLPVASTFFPKPTSFKDDIQIDFTLKKPEVVVEIPFPIPSQKEVFIPEPEQVAESFISKSEKVTTKSDPTNFVKDFDEVAGSVEVSNSLFEKPSVVRSLDFSDEDENTFDATDYGSTEYEIGISGMTPSSAHRKGSEEGTSFEDLGIHPMQHDSLEGPELKKLEVRVLVHNESKDESSLGTATDDEDPGEALPLVLGNEENICTVVNDANAMIGSMHEELEAAAVVFGQRKFSTEEIDEPHISAFKRVVRKDQAPAKISKSEPTFGDQGNDSSSDTELIREDEGFEEFTEDLIPELLTLPIFETDEYIMFENEQLISFNEKLKNDIVTEETELESVIYELEQLKENGPHTLLEIQNCEMEQLLKIWQATKAENEALHENVIKLKELVVMSRLEEFKLETRLRYLEDKVITISPITITTPLQPDI